MCIRDRDRGANLRPIFTPGKQWQVSGRKDRIRFRLEIWDKGAKLGVMKQHLHSCPPRQPANMSESLPIPFAERLLQQALSQLSQLLILRVSADQIPLEELAKREHTLVYRERGQLCICLCLLYTSRCV